MSMAAGVILVHRAGFKLWWEIGAAVLSVPGCALAGELLGTLIEAHAAVPPEARSIRKLAHELRLGALFSFVLLIWMGLAQVHQQSNYPVLTWSVYAGVVVTFPSGLLFAAGVLERTTSDRPSNSG